MARELGGLYPNLSPKFPGAIGKTKGLLNRVKFHDYGP